MTTWDIPLGPTLTEEQAREIFSRGEEAVVFALLHLAKMAAEKDLAASTAVAPDSLSTPSGMQPPYQKPNSSARGKKKPGLKPGHAGNRRDKPTRVDQHKEHRAEQCPECGGALKRCRETRTRYTEDIPAKIQPVVTAHTIHRDWCPRCQKKVEPPVTDAPPGATLGTRVLGLTAWLHYALGTTLSQLVEVFNFHLPLKLSPGGLVPMWDRLQEILFPWYEQIQHQALHAAVLPGDETGWRVNGKTHWVWCFSNPELTYFMIDRSRGSPALRQFFSAEFAGTLVSDFWGAYNAVACPLRQTCLGHLLRDLKQVEQYKAPSEHWGAFAKKLRRLVGDAIRLWRKRTDLPPQTYAARRRCLSVRLQDLIGQPRPDPQALRLIKRLRRHQDDLFTFLDQPHVPFDNNHAERALRPAVIIRKNSYGNRSDRGADTQAVLMSIFRTLKQRGHNPVSTITQALVTYLKTGQLPPLPAKTASDD